MFSLEKATKEELNNFVQSCESGHFMQTSQWLELKTNFGWGNQGQYLVKEQGKILASFSTLKKNKFGINILYVPRGPIFLNDNTEIITFVLNSLKNIAKKEKAFFIRISPDFHENNEKIKNILKNNGFIFSKKQLQTKATMIIDLSKSEQELMSSFHEKTRYNIRLASKKGVIISKLANESELKDFYEVMRKMSERQNYDLQVYEYYQHIWQNLKDIADIYLAKTTENKVIGGIVVFHYSGKSYYMYGGFDYEFRNLMGNYLVHWQIMLDAKARGDQYYDLQGVPLIKDENHPMYGFYRFKKGFNGQEIEFIGEYDFTAHPIIYWFWNNIRLGRGVYLQ